MAPMPGTKRQGFKIEQKTLAVVVAQWVEGLLPTPAICGLNLDTGKILTKRRK